MSELNQKRIDRLDQLWVLLVDAQASALSFLLMRNDAYLEPYRSTATRLEPLMASMNFDIPPDSDDYADLQDLKRLVDAKFQYLGEMLSRGGAPLVLSAEHGELGKQLMDEIRVRLAILKARREKVHQDFENMYLARAKKIQYVGYALGVASLLLILGLFVVQQRQVALRARIQELLKTENSRLEAKVQARTLELSNLATNLTTAQEAERQHIARELHDEMGSALTAAKMDAGWLRRSLGTQVDELVQERMLRLIENIGSTISMTRRLVDDLQPPLLKGLGLVEALRSLGQQFEMEMSVVMDFPEHELSLSPEQSLALFRVAQESLTNVRKYAKASKVELSLKEKQGMVILSVADNGSGFNTENIELHGHGIAGMKHRAQMFNANLLLDSHAGRGTRIEVRMPV